MIDLAEKKESGVFEAFFESLRDRNIQVAEDIVKTKFHLCLKEFEREIRSKLVNERFLKGNEDTKKTWKAQWKNEFF